MLKSVKEGNFQRDWNNLSVCSVSRIKQNSDVYSYDFVLVLLFILKQ